MGRLAGNVTRGNILAARQASVFGYSGRVARAREEAFICGGGASRRMAIGDPIRMYLGQKSQAKQSKGRASKQGMEAQGRQKNNLNYPSLVGKAGRGWMHSGCELDQRSLSMTSHDPGSIYFISLLPGFLRLLRAVTLS